VRFWAKILPRKTNLRLLWRRPGIFLRCYFNVLLALLLASALDAVTTYRNASEYGVEIELHPVQRLVQAMLGPELGVPAAKAIQLGFVVLMAAWWRPWTRLILAVCAGLYLLAGLSNHFHWL
jgi:hypothetical protein